MVELVKDTFPHPCGLGFVTTYKTKLGQLHREDGPAYVLKDPNGKVSYEAWLHFGDFHRFGGPAVSSPGDEHEYWIYWKNVTETVNEWLFDNDYAWETMTDQEKAHLEEFMRTLNE